MLVSKGSMEFKFPTILDSISVLEVTVTKELRNPCVAIFFLRLLQSHKLEGFMFHKSNCNSCLNQISNEIIY